MNEQSVSEMVHPPRRLNQYYFLQSCHHVQLTLTFMIKNSLTSPGNYLKFSKNLSLKQLLRKVAIECGITCFYVSTLTLNILVDRQTM